MSLTIPVFNQSGERVSDVALSSELFIEDHISESLVHEYVVMFLANQRQSGAHTKTRSEVKSSGRKLYRQKGTGNARVGDAGSPIRRSGGVAFGPRSEKNYHKDMPKKMKQRALMSACALRVKNDSGLVMSLDMYSNEKCKTSEFAKFLSTVGVISGKSVLVVFPSYDESAMRSVRNIERLSYVTSDLCTAYDLMSSKYVIFVGDALERMESRMR